jgi:formylmethanofuran dehydrogenase subunit E
MNIPDNYDRWKQHDAEQQAKLDKLPKCFECGEPIQDEYGYEFDKGFMCADCCETHMVYMDWFTDD